MKKIALYILGGFTVLVATISLYVYSQTFISDCRPGPLEPVKSCHGRTAAFSFMSSGWWYTKAEGDMSPRFCNIVKKEDGWIPAVDMPISFYDETQTFTKIECSVVGETSDKICYAAQNVISNGNTRHYFIIVSDQNCQNGSYFEGSKMMMINGKFEYQNHWTEPFPGIPDKQDGVVYGLNIQRSIP